MDKRTILMYGRTNAGKTAQIGQLAEYVFTTTGKRTRLYTADRGGTATIQPYINLGIIDSVPMQDQDPWVFLNSAVRGKMKDATGKWQPGKNDDIGMFAFESFRAFAEALMSSMALKAGQGINIGGGANISFNVKADGEDLKISGSNMAHYGQAQQRMTEEIWESQKLPCQYLLWTSSVSKDEDTNAAGKILGPDVIGKAITAETPRWFDLTIRIDVLPAQQGKPERHLMYLGTHVDVNAGNVAGLGNIRMPLDAPALKETIIEPASIVKALESIKGGATSAEDVIKKRLGDKLNQLKK